MDGNCWWCNNLETHGHHCQHNTWPVEVLSLNTDIRGGCRAAKVTRASWLYIIVWVSSIKLANNLLIHCFEQRWNKNKIRNLPIAILQLSLSLDGVSPWFRFCQLSPILLKVIIDTGIVSALTTWKSDAEGNELSSPATCELHSVQENRVVLLLRKSMSSWCNWYPHAKPEVFLRYHTIIPFSI